MASTAILSENRDVERAMVVVFLRGGADGLHLLTPHGDDVFYQMRPTIGLRKERLVDLDGMFGLHPGLAPLHELWKEGQLCAVHAAGSEDETRSHFEAQDFMEHGGLAAGGWLGRFLRVRKDAGQSPLTAVAIGAQLPECLRGAPSCAALQSLEDFGLGKHASPAMIEQLTGLYARSPGILGDAGANALAALTRILSLSATTYSPSHGARYAEDAFGQGMLQIARLLKARVGLQAATINLDGWDTHLTQDAIIAGPIKRLAQGLHAFARDLGASMLQRTTVVVMSEFGRRVAENSAAGTDHGLGGAMFLLGGGLPGGRMHGEWRGLLGDGLAGPGDLPVLNNYRNILSPLLSRLSPGIALEQVFPGFDLAPLETLAS